MIMENKLLDFLDLIPLLTWHGIVAIRSLLRVEKCVPGCWNNDDDGVVSEESTELSCDTQMSL